MGCAASSSKIQPLPTRTAPDTFAAGPPPPPQLPAGSSIEEAIENDDAVAAQSLFTAAPSLLKDSLLHTAAESGAAGVIEVLLRAGSDRASLDEDLQTPLHVAVANGHLEAAAALTSVQPCVELEKKDKYAMLPLHLACEGGDAQLVALLLARGARVLTTPASPTRPAPAAAPAAAEAEAEAPAPRSPRSSSPEQPRQTFVEGEGEASPPRQPNFGGSPVPKRKQLIAMQQSEIGGSAAFLAKQHSHTEVVALLERAASGETIPMPPLSERSTASSLG